MHQHFLKPDKKAKKQPVYHSSELAFPKGQTKKSATKARREKRDAERDANRKLCLKLDLDKCADPFCNCRTRVGYWQKILSSHHICGRSSNNQFDGVEYRITLSALCHPEWEKKPKEALRRLYALKENPPPQGFRWQPAIDELVSRGHKE